jgi:predicted Holliday junction resolvase-like endonuclease
MEITKNILFYGIGLLAFWVIGYVTALMQAKLWSDKRKKQSLDFQRSVVKGKISEQIAPYLDGFPKDLKPSEAKFVGNPIDFIVFKGVDENNISEVVFVEVKSGKEYRNRNESSLKETIECGRVRYVLYHVPNEVLNK